MKFLIRLILMLFGLLLPLICLEIAVRLLGLAPPVLPNPTIWDRHLDLGWWHIPNSGGVFYSSYNEFAAEVQINALGLRDDLHLDSYELPDKTFKLLILADSFGEALQVDLEDTFFKQLQYKLTDQGWPTQTINGGTGSWGTDQEATFYRLEGRRYQPDLTLLFFFTRNDTLNNYAPLEVARNGGSVQKSFYHLDATGQLHLPAPFDPEVAREQSQSKPLPPAPLLNLADWLWLYSHLYRFSVPHLRDIPPILFALGPSGILGGEGRIRATHPRIPLPFFVYQDPPSAEWEAAWNLTEAILADLHRTIIADGGQLVVILIPAKEQVYPKQWEQTRQAHLSLQNQTWTLELPNQELARRLVRQQIPMLDLLPHFRAADNRALYFVHDGHWTEAGHALAAEAVFQFLYEEGFVSGKISSRLQDMIE